MRQEPDVFVRIARERRYAERRYATTRIEKGLHLQRSNDGERHFYIAQRGKLWAWVALPDDPRSLFAGDKAEMSHAEAVDALDKLGQQAHHGFPTMRQAIAAALASTT